jgi:hypothetical protein
METCLEKTDRNKWEPKLRLAWKNWGPLSWRQIKER